MSRALIDLDRVHANVADFHARCPVPVRAHVKAHRTVEIARIQMAAGACGIAITRAGAEQYVAAGITDVVVAWPWRDRQVLNTFVALATNCRLAIHVDDIAVLQVLSRAARDYSVSVGVRAMTAGVALAVPDSPGLYLDGVAGYHEPGHGSVRDHAERLVGLAEQVRAHGIACPEVAFGGTAAVDAVVPGITELGAGGYALGDAGLAALGGMALDQVAISVDDPALLDGCTQPWLPYPGVPCGRGWLPTHVCPLMLRLPEMQTSSGQRWTVLN